MTALRGAREQTILIVDDAPVSLALAKAMLQRHGLRLAVAQTGHEALQYVAFAPPDLILLDVMLPDINGFEVCRQLKAGTHASIPVIFMTALKKMPDKLAGFQAGAVDYVTKPLQAEEVLARVNAHLLLATMQAQLKEQNTLLATENNDRRKAQQELRQYRDSLELQVAQRTAEVRELAAHRESIREDERKHIARELHDELGQSLTALRLQAGLLRVRFGAEAPGLNEQVNNITALVDRTIAVVRNVTSSLRPTALDLGIGPALEWLVTEFRRHSDIACHLALDIDEGQLNDGQAITIFRVVQESLTNVARHSQASRVAITLHCDAHQCALDIDDDGCGYDSSRIRSQAFGLLGIRERVLSLRGQITIRSQPGGPTHIAATLPLT